MRIRSTEYTHVNHCLQADSIRYVMLVSSASIINASLPSFEAMAGPGTLTVVINNTGNVQSLVTVLVACSSGLAAVGAQQVRATCKW